MNANEKRMQGKRGDQSDKPWWRGAVIYQIYPRSFADSNGDGIGDLKGIRGQLDHIASLGVDGIWISPFFVSPMIDFGYDVADFCDVDPVFGTLGDFDELIEAAHNKGLRVVIDQVYSHTSDRHAWFGDSRASRSNTSAEWYVWADAKPDGSPPNNWQSVFGGPAWTWDARRKQYYFHNFLSAQPDLNLHNPSVRSALLDVAKFWLDRGVDGFRFDALNFAMHDPELRDNPPSGVPMEEVSRPFDMQAHCFNMSHSGIPEFLTEIRQVMDEAGETFSVAEIVGADPYQEMQAFTRGGSHLNTAYSFDFLYAESLTPSVVRQAVEAPCGDWPSWAFSNHDAPRAVSRWAPKAHREQAARMLLMLLLTLRGNIFLYQGEELGLPQADVTFEDLQDPEAIANWPETLGRDGARTPMPWDREKPQAGFSTGQPWLAVDARQAELSVRQQAEDGRSVLNYTRELMALRASTPALRFGGMKVVEAGAQILVLERFEGDQRVWGIFNLSEKPASWALPPSHPGNILAQTGDCAGPEATGRLGIGAYSAIWLAL